MKSPGSFEWRRDQVSAALQAQAKASAPLGEESLDMYVAESYEDFVIVRDYTQNKWWKVGYTITDKGEVTLGETTEVAQTWIDLSKSFRMLVPVQKNDMPKLMRQVTYGVIAEPSTEAVLKADLQGDCYRPEDIEIMAHGFMERSQMGGEMHKALVPGAKVVESYIAPVDFVVKTTDGDETVLKGSWVLAMRWPDEQWGKIEKGEYTGYSIGGTGLRTPINDAAGAQVSGVSKAAGASSEPLPLNWLHSVDVAELSVVDKAANGKRFLILKRAGGYPHDQQDPSTPDGAKPSLVSRVLHAIGKAAGDSGPTTEVEDMTAEEITKAIADGAAEALAPMNERITKLEESLAAEPAEGNAPDPEPVAKQDDPTTPAIPSPEDIQKMVTTGVAEALKPLEERITKMEEARGERQSDLDEGAHPVKKAAGGFWEGSGVLL